jgi:plastocyanin
MKSTIKALLVGTALGTLSSSLHANALTVKVVDRNGTAVPNVVVTLSGSAKVSAAPGTTYAIEQRNFKFEPFVSVVQKGTQVKFPNRDVVDHHVKSLSGPTTFSLKVAGAKQEPVPVLLDAVGQVTVHCLLHNYMTAHLYVVDTPLYGVSDETGTVTIRNVPNAEYELAVNHPSLLSPSLVKPTPPARVKIDGGQPVSLSYTFDFVHRTRR